MGCFKTFVNSLEQALASLQIACKYRLILNDLMKLWKTKYVLNRPISNIHLPSPVVLLGSGAPPAPAMSFDGPLLRNARNLTAFLATSYLYLLILNTNFKKSPISEKITAHATSNFGHTETSECLLLSKYMCMCGSGIYTHIRDGFQETVGKWV